MSEAIGSEGTAASAQTLRRINRELQEMLSHPSPHWSIQSIEDNLLEWHFTIRGPPGTEFENGLYHGRLLLPFNYPFAPPSIMLLNPNGRFETNKKICLSMSNYHPELWQPAWGVRTIMEALRSFFPTPAEGAIGGLDWPVEMRKSLAKDSLEWECPVCKQMNKDILPYVAEDVTKSSSSEVTPPPVLEEPKVVPKEETVSDGNSREEIPHSIPVVKPSTAPTPPLPRTTIINATIVFLIGVIVALVVDLLVRPPQ